MRAHAVEGRVFLASRGGEALPAEGATVRAFDAAAFRRLIGHSGAEKKKYEKLGARLSALFEEAGEIPQQSVSEHERTLLLERNSAETKDLAEQIEAYAYHFLTTLALKPVAETRSDLDGRYTLALPEPAKVVVVVTVERHQATTLEHPCWIVFAPPPELNLTPANRATKMPWEMAP